MNTKANTIEPSPCDQLFKQIADIYVDIDGQKLQGELNRQKAEHPEISLSEKRVEARVMAAVKAEKRAKRRPIYISAVTVLAACFVAAFMFLIPMMTDFDKGIREHPETAVDMSLSTQSQSQASDEDISPELAGTETDTNMTFSADAAGGEELRNAAEATNAPSMSDDGYLASEDASFAQDSGAGPSAQNSNEAIPLGITLPQGYIQTGFEQVQSKSIYYIEDEFQNNIVLILEKTGILPDVETFTETRISDLIVYTAITGESSMLIFIIDGIVHTITGECDINILMKLATVYAENI